VVESIKEMKLAYLLLLSIMDGKIHKPSKELKTMKKDET